MILKHCNRKELLDLLQNGDIKKDGYEVADELSAIRRLRTDAELQLIWQNKYDRLPAAIIVNNAKRDFLAWASTYLNNFNPVTAFFRVLDSNFCSSSTQSTEVNFKLDRKFENLFIGLIIGETLTYLEEGYNLEHVNISTCSRTFSYLMAKAFYLGFIDHFDFLSNSWFKLRQLKPHSHFASSYAISKTPWALLIKLIAHQNSKNLNLFGHEDNSEAFLLLATQDFMLNGKISENILNEFFSSNANIKPSHIFAFEGTREERVLSFQKILPSILDSRHNDQIKSFMAGYLIDRLAPGTFEHFNILRNLTKYLPSSLIWYGFFSGLNKKSQLRNVSFGLGHRLLRDILKVSSIFDRPEADISYDEFNMLFSNMKNLNIRTKIKGQLEIEILPNISTNITWPLDRIEGAQKQVSTYEIQKLKNEFENSISKLEDNYLKILGFFNVSNTPSYTKKTYRKERSKKPK